MKAEELEILSEKVHQVYCKQYEKDHRKPYWTNGDYSKLDEKTKEYDRAIVRFMEQYADEEKKKAFPDTEATGIVFCGKCGTIIDVIRSSQAKQEQL